MAEWSKAHLWRRCVAVKLPWVQIPPSPPVGKCLAMAKIAKALNVSIEDLLK